MVSRCKAMHPGGSAASARVLHCSVGVCCPWCGVFAWCGSKKASLVGKYSRPALPPFLSADIKRVGNGKSGLFSSSEKPLSG